MIWFTKSIPDERLKVWLEFWKAILISGAVAAAIAIVPVWINSEIQRQNTKIAKDKSDADIKLAKINQDKQYVEAFLNQATESNIEKRYMFTQYAKALARDDDLRRGWEELFTAAK